MMERGEYIESDAFPEFNLSEDERMNSNVQKLLGANMDIDFSNTDFGNSQCPWDLADNTTAHKCAVKNISICKYFCGVQYLDSVLCSYPHENLTVLTRDDVDRGNYFLPMK